MGKSLVLIGAIFLLLGVVLIVMGKWVDSGGNLGWLGRLPGDIIIKRDNVTWYFPIATSILISVVGSLLLYFFFRR